MHEQLLADFLGGKAAAAQLGPALLEARLQPDSPNFRTSANYDVVPLQSTVAVGPSDIERLIAAVEAGQLSEEQVGIACFLLEGAVQRFRWDTDTADGERVAQVIFWLGMPAINFPLTPASLAAMRHYLRTGELTFGVDPRGAGA